MEEEQAEKGKKKMATTSQIMIDSCRIGSDADPVTIQAAITDYCFNKCFMCSHWERDDKQEIDTQRWIWFLKSLRDTKTVFYTGGDSMMHRGINEIMVAHLELDIDFGFITTGFIPSNVDMQLLNSSKFFNVSLDSVDEDNYKKIRGGIALHKVLESIEYAKEYGVRVGITALVTEQNSHELDSISNYALRNKFNLRFNFMHEEKKFTDYFIDFYNDRQIDFISEGLELTARFKKHEFNRCYVPYYSMFVDAKGNVYPCCIQAGDTEREDNMEPFGVIEEFSQAKDNRRRFSKIPLNSKCANCIPSFTKINNRLNDFTENDINSIIESHNFY